MVKTKLLIIGSSGHAKVIIDIFEKNSSFEIIGLIDVNKNIGEKIMNYKVLGKENDLPLIFKEFGDCKIFVAIGDNFLRFQVCQKILKNVPNIEFANAIHPSACIANGVRIGKGVAIMAGAIINSDSEISDFCIINTNASLDHDCRMEEFSSLAPGVTIGGNVRIGDFSAILIGASIKNKINVGKHSVLGAGAVLLQDCKDNIMMFGVPAKEIRSRETGEKYM